MKYMGSKRRIAKFIIPIMVNDAKENNITKWVEPFVGGANLIDKVPDSFERVGYDLNPHTIAALIGIRDHLDIFPTSVSEEEYKSLKGTGPDYITSWIRFACSFGGKFENGYSREKGSDSTTFVGYGIRNAIKQSPLIQGIDFITEDYLNLDLKDSLIYCDPPYKGATGYKTGSFDHDKFFEWCRKQAKHNLVYVSEYNAPDDFKCVWSGEVTTNFASQRTEATHKPIEKLFKVTT